ncbi:MAG TPA: hypothetical protein VGG38_09725 [Acidimicrobiales bacterium]|jgi:hypothetical protein
MAIVRLIVAVTFALALSLSVVTAAAANGSTPKVPVLGSHQVYPGPGSVGWGTYKPATIFNGGDPSSDVTHITWTGWGSSTADGHGKSYIFKPNGGYYPGSVTIELRAANLGHCTADGPLAYEHLDAREPNKPGGKLGKWFRWGGNTTVCRSSFVPAP